MMVNETGYRRKPPGQQRSGCLAKVIMIQGWDPDGASGVNL